MNYIEQIFDRCNMETICDGLDITLGEFFSTEEFDGLEQEIK
jgi:hypothetical protein